MGKDNKLVAGMLIGALVGAAASLMDKQTRDDVLECGKNINIKLNKYVKDPTAFTNEVKVKIDDMKHTVKEVSEDITFITEKVNELKTTTPQVVNMLHETKDRFLPKRQ
ncbi:YtxH domain-containing protein [Metabacillus litoralis]|uniref:YtxH domain-containing protein n=1 Tax=Metabacillus litoralis TaxID=152268 RepID=A0A5C6W0N9_9BACI|nr:YtxH domain-containing protein [Metabacillus litoralis]TXC89248.1 YtxH domain-containing protein [Metabacillus litoralis]